MFNQQEYINDFIKKNYKTIRLRIRKDDKLLIDKINSLDNINQYLIGLITKDIYDNRKYNFINNEITIDFEVSDVIQGLIDKAEEADLVDDYGLYMNMVYGIDSRAKSEVTKHQMTESQWNKLLRRYEL